MQQSTICSTGSGVLWNQTWIRVVINRIYRRNFICRFFCETMSVFATLLRSKGNLWIVPILVGALQLTGGIIRKGHIIVAAANLLRNSVDRSINWMWRCNYVRLLNEAISGIAKLFKPFNKFVVLVVDKTCSLLLESLSRLAAPTIIWPFLLNACRQLKGSNQYCNNP